MKKKCENPNGLQNMQTIADAKTITYVKFNSLEKAKRHLKSEGYRFREAFNLREDKDYEIRKINIDAETQKKAIIQFFTENAEVETFGVENFTITRCKEKNT
mgnify:CR=1 FL=1